MKNKNLLISVGLTILSILYTFLVSVVDVKNIGPENTSVGFSSLNGAFRNIFSFNELFYKISQIFGIFLILIAGMYALLGFYQLIKKFSFKKLDKDILMLGCFYLVVLLVYLFFEKVIINYRPVILDEGLEASYPSSHTILALCIGVSSLLVSPRYIKEKYIKFTDIITIILSLGVLIFRTISGVHWISDIIGGIIISATLLMYFYTVYNPLMVKREK